MTMTTTACVTAVALLAGTACFAVPAAAQGTPVRHHAKMSSAHSRALFMSAVAEYAAGLRRGRENSTNNAYLRGFRDGTSSEAYSPRAYVANPYTGNPVALVSPYATPAPAGYSLYDSYTPVTAGYSSYDIRSVGYGDANGYRGRTVAYGDGFASARYDTGYAPGYVPRGLMDVAVAPVAMTSASDTRAAHMSYCAARYQSFDPASNTFLANDGNRYYCQ